MGSWEVEARQQKKPVPCGGCGEGIQHGAIQCKWCPFGDAAGVRSFHLNCAAKAGADKCAPLDRAHLRRHGRLSKQELERLNAVLDGPAGAPAVGASPQKPAGRVGGKGQQALAAAAAASSGGSGGQCSGPAKKKAKTGAGGHAAEGQAGPAPDGAGVLLGAAGADSVPTPEKVPAPAKAGTAGAGGVGSQLGKAQKARVTDVAGDPTAILPPILGVCDAPRQPLASAAAATGVPDMDACSFLASETGSRLAKGDPHGLDKDEAGALNLYTMESKLYPELNSRLRDCDRQRLKQFFPFLQLMLSAKAKLPRYVGTVWRGVKLDLRKQYRKGDEVYWWAFSSTTKSLSTLTNPQFLGKKGTRTIFNVQVKSGVDISAYSVYKDAEAEVLLFPGCKLRVVDTLDMGSKLVMVHLEEVELPVVLMK